MLSRSTGLLSLGLVAAIDGAATLLVDRRAPRIPVRPIRAIDGGLAIYTGVLWFDALRVRPVVAVAVVAVIWVALTVALMLLLGRVPTASPGPERARGQSPGGLPGSARSPLAATC